MKKLYKYKINKQIIYPLIFFMIISLSSIYSAMQLINMPKLIIKQIMWYIVSIITIIIINKIDIKKIYKYYIYLYIFGNVALLLLLFVAPTINNSKCWFIIFGISIQPSEFMKIILIITNACIINNHTGKDYKLILKILLITIIPSILTFLEPDTGMVLVYIIISAVMLFTSGINSKYFSITFLILLLILSIFLSMYYYNIDLFIDIFGNDFFYRMDRLLDWKNGVGMQLTNALISIGSAGVFGFGFNNTPIYFPEPQTDFIFSIYASNYGLIGSIILLLVIVYFDITLIKYSIKEKNSINKFIIIGIISMLIYQQIQNIGMNIGLLPITGITLPFISYGGSSLLSYMICIGIILNIRKNKIT